MLYLSSLSIPIPWYCVSGDRYRTAAEPDVYFTLRPIAYPLALAANSIPIEVKGWLRQGKKYAFQGNDVEHFGLEGELTPTKVSVDRGNYIIEYSSPKYRYGILKDGLTYTFTADGKPDGLFVVVSGDTFWTYAHYGFSGGVDQKGKRSQAWTIVFDGTRIVRRGYTYFTYDYYARSKHPDWSLDDLTKSFVAGVLPIQYPAGSTGSEWSKITSLDFGSFSVDSEDVETLAKHFVKRESRHQLCRSAAQELAKKAWSPCAKRCCDGQRAFDGNALNWISKLNSWGGEIRQSLNLMDNLGNPKEWASTWLSFRFGSRLEWKTSMDVLDAIWDEFLTIKKSTKYSGYRVSRAAETLITPWGEPLDIKMRLVCSNDSMNRLMTVVKSAMDWGYWPSLVNTFDLIPFSFVADWLSNVTTVLDNIDDMIYRQYLKVELCEQSIKTRIPVALADKDRLDANQNVFMTYYSRHGSRKLPEFGVLEGYEPSLPSLVNFVDSVSLLVQLRV